MELPNTLRGYCYASEVIDSKWHRLAGMFQMLGGASKCCSVLVLPYPELSASLGTACLKCAYYWLRVHLAGALLGTCEEWELQRLRDRENVAAFLEGRVGKVSV